MFLKDDQVVILIKHDELVVADRDHLVRPQTQVRRGRLGEFGLVQSSLLDIIGANATTGHISHYDRMRAQRRQAVDKSARLLLIM